VGLPGVRPRAADEMEKGKRKKIQESAEGMGTQEY